MDVDSNGGGGGDEGGGGSGGGGGNGSGGGGGDRHKGGSFGGKKKRSGSGGGAESLGAGENGEGVRGMAAGRRAWVAVRDGAMVVLEDGWAGPFGPPGAVGDGAGCPGQGGWHGWRSVFAGPVGGGEGSPPAFEVVTRPSAFDQEEYELYCRRDEDMSVLNS